MPTTEEMLGHEPKLRAAFALLTAHDRVEEHKPSTKARAVAQAEFNGMCKILDRLRMAPTDFAVEMAVLDSIREAPERPAFSFAGKNIEFREWQVAVCRDIAHRLGWVVD